MKNNKRTRSGKPSGRSLGVRQICAKRPGPPALDAFQLGVRVSEFPREMSFPRYTKADTE